MTLSVRSHAESLYFYSSMSRATQNPEGELNKSKRGSGDGSAFHSVDARFDTLPLFYDLKKIIILKCIRL